MFPMWEDFVSERVITKGGAVALVVMKTLQTATECPWVEAAWSPPG